VAQAGWSQGRFDSVPSLWADEVRNNNNNNNKRRHNMLKKILLNATAVMMLILAGLALGWSFTVGTCNF
jgi:hypothetical protein